MAVPSVDKLTYAQLLDLQVRVAKKVAQRRIEEKDKLKNQLAHLASMSGFTLEELLGQNSSTRKGSKIAVKFRHPNDPSLTWTGRGRQPLWLVGELKKGKKLDNFAI